MGLRCIKTEDVSTLEARDSRAEKVKALVDDGDILKASKFLFHSSLRLSGVFLRCVLISFKLYIHLCFKQQLMTKKIL